MNTPQRHSKTLTARRRRAERTAAARATRPQRRTALPPLPRPGTAAWQAYALGAVQAAEADARSRRRWGPGMACLYQGRRLAYSVTSFGRVLVCIGRQQVGGRFGALWE